MKSRSGVYAPLGLDGYELCHPVMQADFERINVEINGTPRQSAWKPIPMRLVRDDAGKKLVASDSPWLGPHALIFRPAAAEALRQDLTEYGELLPVSCADAGLGGLLVYNPARLIDALDEARSSVLRFGDGRIMTIRRHVFRADLVHNVDVFKIPNLRVSPTFVSRRFVDRWRASGLSGLEFKEVWTPPN